MSPPDPANLQPRELLQIAADFFESRGIAYRIDVDFVASTLTVYSSKTAKQGKAKRVVPILLELRPHLEDAFDPESDRCISRYQTRNLNLRKVFLDILTKAELKPRPRLFHNLRGSLQTDRADRLPSHVVTAWLGNSEPVAQVHKLKVTVEHIAAATQGWDNRWGHLCCQVVEAKGNHFRKTQQKQGKVKNLLRLLGRKIPPTGIEPVTRL